MAAVLWHPPKKVKAMLAGALGDGDTSCWDVGEMEELAGEARIYGRGRKGFRPLVRGRPASGLLVARRGERRT